MKPRRTVKIKSILELMERLPEKERLIVDILRQIIIQNSPDHCKEKISYNVPFFFAKKGICIIWPSTIPRGGISEGVLLGFWYGYKLKDKDRYLTHGTNKKVFYKIYKTAEDINEQAIVKLLNEAFLLDSKN